MVLRELDQIEILLFGPDGHFERGIIELALAGATPGQAILPVLVMLVLGVAFMAVGAALFRRRFA